MTRPNIIELFDAAFNKAIQKTENWISDEKMNANFIEADIWGDLAGEHGRPAIQEVMDTEFNEAMTEWMGTDLSEVKEHFSA